MRQGGHTNEERAVFFAEGQNFDCGSCTRCCRGWSMPVDPHAWDRIVGSPLYERLTRENQHPPVYLEEPEPEAPPKKATKQAKSAAKRPHNMSARTQLKDGACVFLGADKLCGVHKELGASAKPIGCTQFPFIMRPTPDGIYVGVSFYCTAVQANHGRPLEQHEGELERILALHHFPSIGDEVALSDTHNVPWAFYRRMEADLRATLTASPNLRGGVWKSAMRVLLLAATLRRNGGDAGVIWDGLAGAWLERDEMFDSLERMFLTGIVKTIEAQAAGTADSFGDVDPASFDDFRGRFDASWSYPHFRRYMEHLVFRKFLVYKRNIAANTAAWSIMLALLEWYRDVSAFTANRLQPDLTDVHRAFDVVERCFATHTDSCENYFHELARAYIRTLEWFSVHAGPSI